MPEADDSLPPTRYRRRDTDRVSPRRVGLGTVVALIAALGGLKPALDWYAQHARTVREAGKVAALTQRIEELEHDVERLRRYQCVLGWNPPQTRDPHNVCRD